MRVVTDTEHVLRGVTAEKLARAPNAKVRQRTATTEIGRSQRVSNA